MKVSHLPLVGVSSILVFL